MSNDSMPQFTRVVGLSRPPRLRALTRLIIDGFIT